MSSWKKASKVNQKVHQERHQPESRDHLGLLEKKKDYKFRVGDYNKKKDVLKSLQRKALNRNPDEFYFHMINSKLCNGKHKEKVKQNNEDTVEQKKLMENRSMHYVNMKRTIETKKIEKLRTELHITDLAGQTSSNHKYFTDSEEQEEDANDKYQIKDELNNFDLDQYMGIQEGEIKKMNKKKELRYNELAKRIIREKQLNIIHRKMEIQNALKQETASKPKLLKEGTKNSAPLFVWKFERKR